MIYEQEAYRNFRIQREAHRWQVSRFISESQFAQILESHPSDFYSPGFFVRVTLFLATLLAAAAAFGLLTLVFSTGWGETYWGLSALAYGCTLYWLLESYAVRQRKFFKAGVDDALLYLSLGFLLAGLLYLLDSGGIQVSAPLALGMALPLLAWGAIRFADTMLAVALFCALVVYVFTQAAAISPWSRAGLPFLLMLTSTLIYSFSNRNRRQVRYQNWHRILELLRFLGIVAFYAACNYLVVREVSVSVLGQTSAAGEDIPFAMAFKFLTALVPLCYLLVGIRAKDIAFIRAGLLAACFSGFTFSHYYSILQPEFRLLAGGTALLLAAVALVQILKKSSTCFTAKKLLPDSDHFKNAEAYLMAETAAQPSTPGPGSTDPGGGESGGAGAGGSY